MTGWEIAEALTSDLQISSPLSQLGETREEDRDLEQQRSHRDEYGQGHCPAHQMIDVEECRAQQQEQEL